ncbi:hypothetical protein L6Q79_16205, partial [bacterium]|nr:hypothetical protein [bacterium]
HSGQNVVLFQIDKGVTLKSFEGSTISFKRMLSEKRAIRIGLTINGNHTNQDFQTNIPDSVNHFKDSQISSANVTVFLSLQTMKSFGKNIFFYSGYGLTLGFNHYWVNPNIDYRQQADTYTIGPIAYIGVEYFLNSRISLSGEYGLTGYYSYRVSKFKSYYTNTDIGKTKLYEHSFGINSLTPKLGLAIYL